MTLRVWLLLMEVNHLAVQVLVLMMDNGTTFTSWHWRALPCWPLMETRCPQWELPSPFRSGLEEIIFSEVIVGNSLFCNSNVIIMYCQHLIGHTWSALHDCTSEITRFHFLVCHVQDTSRGRTFLHHSAPFRAACSSYMSTNSWSTCNLWSKACWVALRTSVWICVPS